MYACEMNACNVHTCNMRACEMHAREMHVYEMQACEMHAYNKSCLLELHLHSPATSPVALDLIPWGGCSTSLNSTPKTEETEECPKRNRRHTDWYEEGVEDGELPESQHAAIGRRG